MTGWEVLVGLFVMALAEEVGHRADQAWLTKDRQQLKSLATALFLTGMALSLMGIFSTWRGMVSAIARVW